jgi:hypothetical protein
MFPYLKNWFGSQLSNSNQELNEVFKMWLISQAAAFLDIGTQKLIPRYDKCLNSGSDYVEKQLKHVGIFFIS